MRDHLSVAVSATSSTAQVKVEQLTLNETMSSYYFYVLQYKEAGRPMNFSDGPTISHNDASIWIQATIDGLKPGTEYEIQVMPFRKDIGNNITEAGWPTNTTSLKTGE